jgi:Arc/MetJ-type ribon-helix-helix transcriptional regulator
VTTKEAKTIVVQTEIPEGLLTQAQDLVSAGWFRNLDELMLDALRRFLESHRGELMEEFIRQMEVTLAYAIHAPSRFWGQPPHGVSVTMVPDRGIFSG